MFRVKALFSSGTNDVLIAFLGTILLFSNSFFANYANINPFLFGKIRTIRLLISDNLVSNNQVGLFKFSYYIFLIYVFISMLLFKNEITCLVLERLKNKGKTNVSAFPAAIFAFFCSIFGFMMFGLLYPQEENEFHGAHFFTMIKTMFLFSTYFLGLSTALFFGMIKKVCTSYHSNSEPEA